MANFLKLIRYKNLLMIVLVQLLIKYALFHPFKIDVTLGDLSYALLILATVCIAAAGNVINDIQDVAIDQINKPNQVLIGKKITEKTAYNYYIILNVIGVGTGFYLANSIGKPGFAALFIVFSALLYLYATYLKSIVFIGNVVVSVLVAMSILIVGLFDLFPAITEANRIGQATIFSILSDYAIFAFMITFTRELIKDIEDVDGDKNGGMQTFPVLIGRSRATKVAFFIAILIVAAVIYYVYTYLYRQQLIMLYMLLLVIGPLLYFCIKLFSAEKKSDYHSLSNLLKLIMLFGILSLTLYPFLLN